MGDNQGDHGGEKVSPPGLRGGLPPGLAKRAGDSQEAEDAQGAQGTQQGTGAAITININVGGGTDSSQVSQLGQIVSNGGTLSTGSGPLAALGSLLTDGTSGSQNPLLATVNRELDLSQQSG